MNGNRKARRAAQFAAKAASSRHTRSAARRGVRRVGVATPVSREDMMRWAFDRTVEQHGEALSALAGM